MSLGLERFAAGAKPEPEPTLWTPKPVWEGQIVAFDQTMSATGWACVHADATGDVTVHKTGMCVTDTLGIKGYGDYMERVALLRRQIRQALRDTPTAVGHEEPPMGGGKMNNPDSSLVAGAIVRCVADERDLPVVMVHAKHAKKVITGNGNADKKLVRQHLERALPSMKGLKPMNYNVSDAIAIAVVAFEKEPTWS